MAFGDRSFWEEKPYFARLDGAVGVLWEPLWQLHTSLRPVERGLLRAAPLRRLHFVRHGGGSSLCTPHVQSRLQHTLGVFALVAYFRPDDGILRAAALLHDVGHAPFSHALERIPGVDHHRWTAERILQEPIAGLLTEHGLNPAAVLACLSGKPNLLHNDEGILHVDHLDSWVRSAHASGILPRPAPQILAGLRLRGSFLETDLETAELLAELIVAEARFHTATANVGPNVILADLVRGLLETGVLSLEDLPTMTDAGLERALFGAAATAEQAQRLWYRPYQIVAHRLGGEETPPGARIAQVDHLYLAMPLTDGQLVTEKSARAAALVRKAQSWLGTYAVYWAEEGAPGTLTRSREAGDPLPAAECTQETPRRRQHRADGV